MSSPSSVKNADTAQILRNAMLFSLTRHIWSNRASADRSKVETTGDKKKLNLTKKLLVSPELDVLTDYLSEVYTWCLKRSMQSTAVRRGIYFVKRDQISIFEKKLAEASDRIREKLIPAFLKTYEDCKTKMRTLPAVEGGLGDLYNEEDYPKAEVLKYGFSLSWSWLALSVPKELPEEVRRREVKKLEASFQEAQEEIKFALRNGFKELVDRAVERLTVKEGEKPKVFRDSLIENFNEFFETFSARNLMDDSELAAAVEQAKKVVKSLPEVEKIRDSAELRSTTAASFAAVNDAMSKLVIDKPSRKFDMEA